jgi:hypothetical protein
MLEEFINKFNIIYQNKYDYSFVIYKNTKTKIKIVCPIHGIFEKTPQTHLNQGCPKCSYDILSKKYRISHEILLQQFQLIHHNKYDYSLVNYINNETNIKIICPIHGIFEQNPKNHKNGSECPKCSILTKSNKQSKSVDELITQFKEIHQEKYDYSKVNYINNRSKIIITCKTHGDFNILPYHHLAGTGCSKCANNYNKSNDEFIIECSNIHNNKYDYSLTNHINNKTKVIILCKKHGEFLQDPAHHLNGHGCPKCNSSKGEIKIREILNKHNIKFVEQKKFINCKNKQNNRSLRFDFYLIEFNICVEFDGIQHFESKSSWGGEKQFLKNLENDKIKNIFCKKNKIKLKRIPYTKYDQLEKIIEKIIK